MMEVVLLISQVIGQREKERDLIQPYDFLKPIYNEEMKIKRKHERHQKLG